MLITEAHELPVYAHSIPQYRVVSPTHRERENEDMVQYRPGAADSYTRCDEDGWERERCIWERRQL